MSRWFTDTADGEDENVARTLAADEENARALNGVRPKSGDALPGGSAGGSRISRMLNPQDGGAGSNGGGLADASGPSGSRATSEMDTAGDPVDVATGDVVLSQADVTLAGVLPLVLERTHRSSHRTGRWLGKSWVSSFDQRLEVRGSQVTGAFSDGRVLTWARPDGGEDLLPEHGPAWPLRRDGDAWLVTDRQRGLTWRFEQRPGHWWSGIGGGQGELPLVAVIDRAGHEIKFAYDESGRLAGWTDRNGYSYRYAYDEDGRCVRGESPSGALSGTFAYDGEARVTVWTDGAGAVTRYRRDDPFGITGVIDAVGSETRTLRDARGRVTTRVDPLGRATRYAFDDRGNLAAVTRPDGAVARAEYDERCLPVSITEAGGSTWRQEFDAAGNRIAVTAPDGSVESWEWDAEGNLLRHVSPGGAVTSSEYGAFDKPAAMTWADGTRTSFVYDREQRLTSVEHGGLAWAYAYDPAGRLIVETDYNGAVTRYGWDVGGQLVSKVNAAGQETVFGYDSIGNLVSQASGGAETAFGYDLAGRLVSARNADAVVEFERDALGRVTAETCDGRTVRTSYDAAGRAVSRVTPSGAVSDWSFDLAGRSAVLNSSGRRHAPGNRRRVARRHRPGAAVGVGDADPAGREHPLPARRRRAGHHPHPDPAVPQARDLALRMGCEQPAHLRDHAGRVGMAVPL